jgi:hypothetical protein
MEEVNKENQDFDKAMKAKKLVEETKKRAEEVIAGITGKLTSESIESVNKVPELEDKDFRVDSSTWEIITEKDEN